MDDAYSLIRKFKQYVSSLSKEEIDQILNTIYRELLGENEDNV